MTEKISLTILQQDYLLALRSKKVLCPVCEKTSAIFLKVSIYTIKQCMETTYLRILILLSEQVLVASEETCIYLKFIFDICIFRNVSKTKLKKRVCIAYRTIITFIIKTENTIQLFQLQQYL
jgi:hypothetical protein